MDELTTEREYAAQGYFCAAGVDEVGRGPLAGPVVCAAVILSLEEARRIPGIDDSKKLSPKKREQLAALIRERARAWAVAEVSNEVIDEINILQATRLCMKRAVEALEISADVVLVDGNMTLDIALPQRAFVKGDARIACIAAASIVAKVTRDALMVSLDEEYPGYHLAECKGYGSADHIAAIREKGLTPLHRASFCGNFVENLTLF